MACRRRQWSARGRRLVRGVLHRVLAVRRIPTIRRQLRVIPTGRGDLRRSPTSRRRSRADRSDLVELLSSDRVRRSVARNREVRRRQAVDRLHDLPRVPRTAPRESLRLPRQHRRQVAGVVRTLRIPHREPGHARPVDDRRIDNLPYEEKDIIQNPAFRWEMEQKSGQPLSPCVEINGAMLADVSGEEVERYMIDQQIIQPSAATPDAPIDRACSDEQHAAMARQVAPVGNIKFIA